MGSLLGTGWQDAPERRIDAAGEKGNFRTWLASSWREGSTNSGRSTSRSSHVLIGKCRSKIADCSHGIARFCWMVLSTWDYDRPCGPDTLSLLYSLCLGMGRRRRSNVSQILLRYEIDRMLTLLFRETANVTIERLVKGVLSSSLLYLDHRKLHHPNRNEAKRRQHRRLRRRPQ